MVERWRDVEPVADSDPVPGPKEDDSGSEGNLHHLEGERRQGVDQSSGQVALDDREEEEEEDSEFASDDGDSDGDLKTDSACASDVLSLAAQKSSECRPSFGNIVVNSSSDVHFGNKTFYNGPVTIKQIVYTTKNGSVDVHHGEGDDANGDSTGGVDEVLGPVASGLPNGKVQCSTPSSENVLSVPSALTISSDAPPGVNGSLLPTWQPSESEYTVRKTQSNPTG
jgi:hypothetical protein